MPTGYTAPIYEGDSITFPEFAFNCARAFGASVMLRDASGDVRPNEANVTDTTTYHLDRLAEAEARLEVLVAMTTEAAASAAELEHEHELLDYRKATGRYIALKKRYQAMRAEVEAWEPPTEDHVGLKTFMLEQIDESLRFDCHQPDAPPARCLTPAEWFKREMERAQRDLDYNREEQAKLEERNENRSAWVKALRESLEGVPA